MARGFFGFLQPWFLKPKLDMFELADLGNKSKVNSVWVVFWYYWNYMVVIGKKLPTNKNLNRWLTNLNRNFNETN